ncbi:putative methyltransferase YcgJ [Stieleria maiorica]|uniref:Putative methyltransferase YcgJ n=1 Tax=Stieleria maiorica TaxID=2795974 RepID=A0A5B9M4T1_9BACT|nr:methyltransferase domain-containing protein [Stieleria maiorica]QEF96248.1 putative methyltransferase YcgJ [Stieleria maiorica]
MDPNTHSALTIEQFTRQAVPFASLPGHSAAMDILVELAAPGPEDDMLDVACGPGIVACHFAPLVGSVTGLDLTPEMIRQARMRQSEQGIKNASWIEGSAALLPFDDATFSLVLTRYSFHHFQAPAQVLSEMRRVCKPGGRVVVADVSLPSDKVAGYDEIELLRDPSHVHALSRDEFADLFSSDEFDRVQFKEYKVELTLEEQLAVSFPVPGGADRIRNLMQNDVGVDRIGVQASLDDGTLRYSIPITVAAATTARSG